LPPSLTALGEGSHGSVLNGNYLPNRLSSAWKPTAPALNLPLALFGSAFCGDVTLLVAVDC
ncbi:hypothetical protein, partial [Agrobacterium tumefaciens]|uniref:hypothetical protein n=1 Tax=Agrobacterium tumefaciens TaxID=358 RepID=UPI001BA78EE7